MSLHTTIKAALGLSELHQYFLGEGAVKESFVDRNPIQQLPSSFRRVSTALKGLPFSMISKIIRHRSLSLQNEGYPYDFIGYAVLARGADAT
jgi:hypothetical protein